MAATAEASSSNSKAAPAMLLPSAPLLEDKRRRRPIANGNSDDPLAMRPSRSAPLSDRHIDPRTSSPSTSRFQQQQQHSDRSHLSETSQRPKSNTFLPLDPDLLVQAAHPDHPDHQVWLERFNSSASSKRRGLHLSNGGSSMDRSMTAPASPVSSIRRKRRDGAHLHAAEQSAEGPQAGPSVARLDLPSRAARHREGTASPALSMTATNSGTDAGFQDSSASSSDEVYRRSRTGPTPPSPARRRRPVSINGQLSGAGIEASPSTTSTRPKGRRRKSRSKGARSRTPAPPSPPPPPALPPRISSVVSPSGEMTDGSPLPSTPFPLPPNGFRREMSVTFLQDQEPPAFSSHVRGHTHPGIQTEGAQSSMGPPRAALPPFNESRRPSDFTAFAQPASLPLRASSSRANHAPSGPYPPAVVPDTSAPKPYPFLIRTPAEQDQADATSTPRPSQRRGVSLDLLRENLRLPTARPTPQAATESTKPANLRNRTSMDILRPVLMSFGRSASSSNTAVQPAEEIGSSEDEAAAGTKPKTFRNRLASLGSALRRPSMDQSNVTAPPIQLPAVSSATGNEQYAIPAYRPRATQSMDLHRVPVPRLGDLLRPEVTTPPRRSSSEHSRLSSRGQQTMRAGNRIRLSYVGEDADEMEGDDGLGELPNQQLGPGQSLFRSEEQSSGSWQTNRFLSAPDEMAQSSRFNAWETTPPIGLPTTTTSQFGSGIVPRLSMSPEKRPATTDGAAQQLNGSAGKSQAKRGTLASIWRRARQGSSSMPTDRTALSSIYDFGQQSQVSLDSNLQSNGYSVPPSRNGHADSMEVLDEPQSGDTMFYTADGRLTSAASSRPPASGWRSRVSSFTSMRSSRHERQGSVETASSSLRETTPSMPTHRSGSINSSQTTPTEASGPQQNIVLQALAAGRKSFSRTRSRPNGMTPSGSQADLHPTIRRTLSKDLLSERQAGLVGPSESELGHDEQISRDDEGDEEPWDGMEDERPTPRPSGLGIDAMPQGLPTATPLPVVEEARESTNGHGPPPSRPAESNGVASQQQQHQPPKRPEVPARSERRPSATSTSALPSPPSSSAHEVNGTTSSFSDRRTALGLGAAPGFIAIDRPESNSSGTAATMSNGTASSPWSRGSKAGKSLFSPLSFSDSTHGSSPSRSGGAAIGRTSFSMDRDRTPVASPYMGKHPVSSQQSTGNASVGKKTGGGFRNAFKKFATGGGGSAGASNPPVSSSQSTTSGRSDRRLGSMSSSMSKGGMGSELYSFAEEEEEPNSNQGPSPDDASRRPSEPLTRVFPSMTLAREQSRLRMASYPGDSTPARARVPDARQVNYSSPLDEDYDLRAGASSPTPLGASQDEALSPFSTSLSNGVFAGPKSTPTRKGLMAPQLPPISTDLPSPSSPLASPGPNPEISAFEAMLRAQKAREEATLKKITSRVGLSNKGSGSIASSQQQGQQSADGTTVNNTLNDELSSMSAASRPTTTETTPDPSGEGAETMVGTGDVAYGGAEKDGVITMTTTSLMEDGYGTGAAGRDQQRSISVG